MHFINGVRQSPFPNGHWTDGLSQHEITDTLMTNGKADEYLEYLSHEASQCNYFNAVTNAVFYDENNLKLLDDYVIYDIAVAMFVRMHLVDKKDAIEYQNKEVGALIRFDNRVLHDSGIIHPEVLIEQTRNMDLNSAQIVELEMLLNKVDRSLNIRMPIIPEPTDEELRSELERLYTWKAIQAKPRKFYNDFKLALLVLGIPTKMNSKELLQYAEKVFNP